MSYDTPNRSYQTDREIALRAHIHNLLYDYALTHLTTNYITFTQEAVTELLTQSLHYIPDTDPTALTLPTDPFDDLFHRLKLDDLTPYDEVWSLDPDAVTYLRSSMSTRGKPRTISCWFEDDERELSLRRPMSPILTRKALRETPRIGSNKFTNSLPDSFAEFIASHRIKTVAEEDIPDPPTVNLEDALNLKLQLEPPTQELIRKFLKVIPSLSRPRQPQVNRNVQEFLRAESPPLNQIRYASPPIFARDCRPGSSRPLGVPHPSGLKGMMDISAMMPKVKVEEENEDLYMQHMLVVDGWRESIHPLRFGRIDRPAKMTRSETIAPTSSPSSFGTPSLGDDTSQIDELFLLSPQDSKKQPIEALMSARMEDVLVPREERLGASHKPTKRMGDGKSLASFLSPLLQAPRPSHPRIVTTPKSHPSSPSNCITASMLGQPPSDLEDPGDLGGMSRWNNNLSSSDDFDALLGKVYAGAQIGDPMQLILQEKLDEKESLLMDGEFFRYILSTDIPIDLRSLVIPPRKKNVPEGNTQEESLSKFAYLKKVKGIQSLNIELSWRPFKFGPTIPTHDEVARVSTFEDPAPQYPDDHFENAQVQALIQRCLVVDGPSSSSQRFLDWNEDDDHLSAAGSVQPDDFQPIMTREDRRRIARLSGLQEEQSDGSDCGSDDKENEMQALPPQPGPKTRHRREASDDPSLEEAPAAKKTRVSQSRLENVRLVIPVVPEEPDHWDDDSGVALPPNNMDWQGRLPAQLDGPSHFYRHSPEPILDLDDDIWPPNQRMDDLASATQSSHACDDASMPMGSYDYSLFAPLSFESTQRPSVPAPNPDGASWDPTTDFSQDWQPPSPFPPPAPPALSTIDRRHQTTYLPAIESMSVGQNILEFMNLRSKQTGTLPDPLPPIPTSSMTLDEHTIVHPPSPPQSREPPDELLDRNTLRHPDSWSSPVSVHRYMASLELIQKRALVSSLRSSDFAVDLVERSSLHLVDLILDPHTAITFASLAALPGQSQDLANKLADLSWRYSSVLVIFEAFPSSETYRLDNESAARPRLNLFSPPVIKAVKKLRRDLGVAEACNTKCSDAVIQFAFATSVEEVAMFTRMFGDMALRRDETGGAIWNDREWLEMDETQEEFDLSLQPVMNPFAAAIILSQISLGELLEMTPDVRLQQFGWLVGNDRIVQLNDTISRRTREVRSPDTSSVLPEVQGGGEMQWAVEGVDNL
ncbi:hypothetical protein JAAARDRAFT_202531 [Jaapia argillacea MUCL 33604]|uniref:Uncharacterized protein n=1 Tax=Jaapia argillacea MUCL 33604 TaxID=933084 RepID=A0A067QHN3_9AGAM|nr:hypothetical protein JAAARDRAFT_202531 [Jaapia argillacea MUCL 33604]